MGTNEHGARRTYAVTLDGGWYKFTGRGDELSDAVANLLLEVASVANSGDLLELRHTLLAWRENTVKHSLYRGEVMQPVFTREDVGLLRGTVPAAWFDARDPDNNYNKLKNLADRIEQALPIEKPDAA